MVEVEIVYVARDKTVIQWKHQLPAGSTVADAIKESGLLVSHPEIQGLTFGIFAKIVTPDTIIKNGDRIEIYRPLISDPKEKRRIKAKLKK
jgi:putative ubiquitin-RnfH superfamily antitoxin RatB of RatAB toxin-antitoxin module